MDPISYVISHTFEINHWCTPTVGISHLKSEILFMIGCGGPPGREAPGGEARGEPSLREAPQELQHRSGHPAQEGSHQIREMAQVS